jgi:hypothetical protein
MSWWDDAQNAVGRFYNNVSGQTEADALDASAAKSEARGDQAREMQMMGANRALSFYGPARDVFKSFFGAPQSGFGQTQVQPNAAIPTLRQTPPPAAR